MTATHPLARSTTEAFTSRDAVFAAVTGSAPALVRVIEIDAHEGPTYVPDEDAVYVTTVPRAGASGAPRAQVNRIGLDGERFPLEPDRFTAVPADVITPNGMTAAPDGTLVLCDQGDLTHEARLTPLNPCTGATAGVDSWLGRRLNSPNDVAVRSDGAIWFTDPSYGCLQGFRPEPVRCDRPPSLGARQVLDVTTPGFPDGITVDEDGRVYVSCSDGIRVPSADGIPLGLINLAGTVNFTFRRPERQLPVHHRGHRDRGGHPRHEGA